MSDFIISHPTSDAQLYDRGYFDQYYTLDRQREAMYLLERDRIKEYFPRGGNVLDIGCGVGGFLDTFDDRWKKYGVEPSEFAAEKAKKKNIEMLKSVNVADFDQFDVVVFRGSLQHIAYPMEALSHAWRSLRRGGLLVVLATPDTDSLVYKIWGNLPALDAPRNWVLFGHRALTNILSRLGFENIRVLHPYWDTPYARPVWDFTRFLLSIVGGYRKFAFPGNMMEIYAIKK